MWTASVLQAFAQPALPLTEPQSARRDSASSRVATRTGVGRPRRAGLVARRTPDAVEAGQTDMAGLDVEGFAETLAREIPGVESLKVGRDIPAGVGLREGDIVLADGGPGRSPAAPGRGVFAILRVHR